MTKQTSKTETIKGAESVMNAKDVVDIYRLLSNSDIDIWVDGGWGVDALLKEQTRQHGDLDIAIESRHVPRMRELLTERGYRESGRDNTRPWNFVLVDGHGREIDVHAIDFDGAGNGVLGPPENNSVYPAGSLTGLGEIDGQAVRCISADHMVQFHTGYPLDDNDRRDVFALCERFGINLPEKYKAR